ncbi:MAG: protein kinase, partial [Anaerolinea sp.]|nr:protein kinase [Anaerolinea sp.]
MLTDQLIGRQIDDFTIQERIGRGGMATVYRAYQASANRQVALKIISLAGEHAQIDEFQRRFDQEARLVSSLEHSHIVPIIKYGLAPGEFAYLAMRLLRGGSLSNLLLHGPLTLDRTVDIFSQIGGALAYAHSRGVIHRDLKPSNILLGDAGEPYLTDFGLAKMLAQSLELTKSDHIVGTPAYMSPEQLRGDVLDVRSDIYSMSVVLYHMLTGRPPFEATESNVVSVIYQHLEKPPPSLRSLNPAIPETVENVVLRGLQKDPADRYPSIAEMVDDLNRAAGRRTSTSTAPPVRLARSQTARNDAPAEPTSTASYTPPVPPVPPPERRAAPAVDETGIQADVPARTIAIPSKKPERVRPPLIILLAFGVAGILIVLLLLFSLIEDGRPAPPRVFVVLEGETGPADLAVPTADEIAAARAAVGSSGFIAYLACLRTSEYHAAQAREMGDFAAEYGLPYRVYDAENDPYRQLTQIDQARTDGASALILCPLDLNLLSEPLSAVEAVHLPLVILSSGVENYGGVLLGGDDYQMGLTAGRAAGTIAPSVVGADLRAVVLGFPDLAVLVERARGLVDGLREVAPDAAIAAELLGGTRENGYRSIRQALADGLTFNVILSINDAGAYGAAEALREAG